MEISREFFLVELDWIDWIDRISYRLKLIGSMRNLILRFLDSRIDYSIIYSIENENEPKTS